MRNAVNKAELLTEEMVCDVTMPRLPPRAHPRAKTPGCICCMLHLQLNDSLKKVEAVLSGADGSLVQSRPRKFLKH